MRRNIRQVENNTKQGRRERNEARKVTKEKGSIREGRRAWKYTKK